MATAALEVISEVGISRTTHRAVAARAGLPLGATTYYFPTLDDLITAGLRLSAADLQSDFQEWAGRLREASDIPAAVAAFIVEYVTDRQRAQLECELYVVAGRDPALRPLAMAWLTGMRDLLEPHVGVDAARDVVTFFDGVTLRALITGQEVDLQALTSAIRRLTTP
nr:TetR family transcriptional regulator [Actinoplanes hotanensis]